MVLFSLWSQEFYQPISSHLGPYAFLPKDYLIYVAHRLRIMTSSSTCEHHTLMLKAHHNLLLLLQMTVVDHPRSVLITHVWECRESDEAEEVAGVLTGRALWALI